MANWSKELIAVEAAAKERASVLFFVIDSLTRAVSSMNEVVEEICRGRKVVLVVQDMDVDCSLCNGSANLRADLNRGREYVRDIARRYGVITFDDIATAAEHYILNYNTSSRLQQTLAPTRQTPKVLNNSVMRKTSNALLNHAHRARASPWRASLSATSSR